MTSKEILPATFDLIVGTYIISEDEVFLSGYSVSGNIGCTVDEGTNIYTSLSGKAAGFLTNTAYSCIAPTA